MINESVVGPCSGSSVPSNKGEIDTYVRNVCKIFGTASIIALPVTFLAEHFGFISHETAKKFYFGEIVGVGVGEFPHIYDGYNRWAPELAKKWVGTAQGLVRLPQSTESTASASSYSYEPWRSKC